MKRHTHRHKRGESNFRIEALNFTSEILISAFSSNGAPCYINMFQRIFSQHHELSHLSTVIAYQPTRLLSSREKICTNLQVKSYADYVSDDGQTLLSLHSAAIDDGSFYPDLTGKRSPAILPDVADLMTANAKPSKLPLAEKMEMDTNKLGSLTKL